MIVTVMKSTQQQQRMFKQQSTADSIHVNVLSECYSNLANISNHSSCWCNYVEIHILFHYRDKVLHKLRTSAAAAQANSGRSAILRDTTHGYSKFAYYFLRRESSYASHHEWFEYATATVWTQDRPSPVGLHLSPHLLNPGGVVCPQALLCLSLLPKLPSEGVQLYLKEHMDIVGRTLNQI